MPWLDSSQSLSTHSLTYALNTHLQDLEFQDVLTFRCGVNFPVGLFAMLKDRLNCGTPLTHRTIVMLQVSPIFMAGF
jgi:hypothetical protein